MIACAPSSIRPGNASRERGSVLILVLWIAFGLVSIALYFGHSMTFELRASDNRVAGYEADQAIEGAARYVLYLLSNLEEPGKIPDLITYRREAVPLGSATFWFVGRDDQQRSLNAPFFGLVDEASRLNLNTARREMLEALPRMTPELAAAIIDWRDANNEVTAGGAESDIYLRRQPAYACKNAPFESIEELRLVMGADMDILYGEDTNLNGILDRNENDGTVSAPADNHDGRLDPGILEYVTVHSREPNIRSDGTPRVNVSGAGNQAQLATLLQSKFNAARANQILQQVRNGTNGSVLQFFTRSGMTPEEFAQISGDITTANGQFVSGLVNVNTASEAVLTCLPGVGVDKASAVVAYRQSNRDKLTSVAWLVEVLGTAGAREAGPYVTSRSYQFSADIAAVGHHGRGYRRSRYIFDTSDQSPKIRHRQDLNQLGWALGTETRQKLLVAAQTPR